MTDSDKVFDGSIPELYETFLVPLLFETYAADIAQRVAALAPKTVLETAAGTGVVTRALANRLGADASYIVTDLNQPMLNLAENKQGLDDKITWKIADALNLPFDDSKFDVVLCQFGVMFFPDRRAGYLEAYRVLKPGGRFLFNVWDHITVNEFALEVEGAAATHFPDDQPRFLSRTPHGYSDMGLIEKELNNAGFSKISITTMKATSLAQSAGHAAIAYCQGTPLRNEIEARNSELLEQVTESATRAIVRKFGSGPVSGKIRAHVVEAIR